MKKKKKKDEKVERMRIRIRINNKAISPLVGAILIFAIIIGFIGILQNFFVPEWMKSDEWNHYTYLSSEFSSIPKLVALSASSGNPNVVKIDMGVEHSNYPLLFTPPDTASSIKAEKLWVNISYYEIYPNGTISPQKNLNLTTSALILSPAYLYLDNVDFIFEHGYAFKRYEDSNTSMVMVEQSSFRNGSYTIYIFNTTFDSLSSRDVLNLVINPVSYGGEISIKNATIVFESLNPEYWNKTLRSIAQVNVSGNKVVVKVDGGILRINELSISPSETSQSSKEIYIFTSLSRLDVFVGEIERVEAIVRDQFGNPVAGKQVNASVSGGIGYMLENTAITNSDGIAVFYFKATNFGSGNIIFEVNVSKYMAKQAILPVKVMEMPSGKGGGGASNWDRDTYNTSLVVSPDLVWTGIYNASKIILKNAMNVGHNSEFELQFVIYNQSTYYTFEVKEDGRLHIYKPGVTPNNRIFNSKFKDSAWDNIFTSTGTDLLDENSYKSGELTQDEKDVLQEIRNFLRNATPSDPINLAVQWIGHESKGDWIVQIQII